VRNIKYGYIRVSTKEQNINRQVDALLRCDIPMKNLFIDKESGKDFERPRYKRLIKRLQPGDCMYVTSLDRLGRNYSEIQEEWRYITKEKNVDIVVLDMPLLNTKQTKDNLLGKFLADIVLQILSYVAETERHNIKKRQAEGIAAAKARGVRFGRRDIPVPDNFSAVVQLWQSQQITAREAAKRLHVSTSWFYRKIDILPDK